LLRRGVGGVCLYPADGLSQIVARHITASKLRCVD